jgi:hypothetical protein
MGVASGDASGRSRNRHRRHKLAERRSNASNINSYSGRLFFRVVAEESADLTSGRVAAARRNLPDAVIHLSSTFAVTLDKAHLIGGLPAHKEAAR